MSLASWSSDSLRIAGCVADSIVDGPGLRFVVFVQGCPHHCPGCHNPHTHDFDGGREVSVQRVADAVTEAKLCQGVTFSGGEPFCQPEALANLACILHSRSLEVMVYTGYTYEELLELSETRPGVLQLLEETDILVDGLYLEDQRDLTLPFRGSKNQRILRMKQGKIVGTISDAEISGQPKAVLKDMPV